MTLFQVVTLDSPIKLTPKGQKQLQTFGNFITPANWKKLIIDSLDAIEEGLSLSKSGKDQYFMEKIDKDLNG
ncbi:MAG: hypothetical protein K9K67_09820 [Bacteriovoracaceae bacterium]|nr:hypothetical protein [Bacteriovoracaceae bacterium]